MNKKYVKIGVSKKALIISVILLLMLSLAIMPTSDSVVSGATTVDMELDAGWNFLGMPESISASELALKSKDISSVVRMTADGYYVSYIPSLGKTDFICEPNEAIYIYSNVGTTISFTIIDPGDISGDLLVSGDTILNKNLTVNGNMSVAGDLEINNLNVTEDLTVDGNLTVNEYLTVGKDLFVSGSLIVSEDLTVGDLIVTKDMTIEDDLSVIGDAIIDGDSTVEGDSTTGGDSTVEGDMGINGNLTVAKDATIGGNSIVVGDMTINEDLTVIGNSTTGGDSTVAGDMTIDGNLFVAEDLAIGDDLLVAGNSTVDGHLSVLGDAAIGDDLTVAGNSTVEGNLSVAGDALIGDDLTVSGDSIIDGNLSVAKDTAIGDDLTVGGDTIINGNLTVVKDTAIGDDLTVSGDSIIDGNLTVARDASIGGDLMVGGDATITGKLTAGDFTVGNLTITEDLSIDGNLSVAGDAVIGDDLTVGGDAVIAGTLTAGDFTVVNLTIAEDLSINGNLSVAGDAIIGGDLTVTDDITIQGNYAITGDLTVGGDLFVTGNITGLALGDIADYVIFEDSDNNVNARNGYTGAIDFKGTDAATVIQQAIDSIGGDGGSIFLRKSLYSYMYQIPLRFRVAVDYKIDTTIDVLPGISIFSDGAILDVSDLDDTVFRLNPTGQDYGSGHFIWKISNLGFVGDQTNRNTCAIHAYRWQYALIIDNIHCEEVTNPIKIEGTAYRTVVQNCLFIVGAGNEGEVGVHIFKGRGPYSPNGATVVNSDISTMKTAIQIDDGYGVRVANNYFEGNGISVNSSGGTVTVIGNYFQPDPNGIGIYAYGGTVITGNAFLIGRNTNNVKAIMADRSNGAIQVTGNMLGTDDVGTDGAVFFYSRVPTRATITGNTVYVRVHGIGSFIDAYLTGSSVTGNHIGRGDVGINQRESPADQVNVISSNMFFDASTGIITGGNDQIIGNSFNAGDTDIKVLGGGNHIKGNYLRATTRIDTSEMGGGNIIENNIGFVTENSGVISVTDGTWVDHGLESTPTIVTLTPQSIVTVWIMAKTATQFQVGVSSAAAITVNWYAIYKP